MDGKREVFQDVPTHRRLAHMLLADALSCNQIAAPTREPSRTIDGIPHFEHRI